MADPYFNPHSLRLDFHKSHEAVTSIRSSVLNDCPQHSGVAFGLEVQQTAPINHLNTLNPYYESFRNPCSDYRFPKVPVRAIYHQEPEQSEPLELSDKTKAHQQSDENILFHTSQSELRIDRVWSMAVEASSQSHSINVNANHPPLDSTLKDTAGNGFLGMGQSIPQILSVVDNKLHQPVHIPDQDRIDTFSKPEAPIAIITPQLNSEQLQQNTSSARNEFNFNASASVSGESLTISPDKASQKAYRESDKGKAYQKAYQKAYAQSEKQKAYQKAYAQSEKRKAYQKAYYEVFKNTGDREQAKIAGKQATAFITESNKAKNSELESTSISPLSPPASQID